jgi:penicillin-binding protein 1C
VARQPGSALKPFTYALAFESGFNPASVLPDIPSNFPTAEPGVLYAPRNYDRQYRGPLLARRALAGSEVRLDELVAAYSAFARGGQWIAPTYRADAPHPAGHTLVSPRTAFWITDVLSDPEAREYVFGRGGSLEFPFPVAVKTGTSQAYHDNWTIGYSRHVTVGGLELAVSIEPLRNSSRVTARVRSFMP